jgi:DNA-binding GntR family transcriptional regulator
MSLDDVGNEPEEDGRPSARGRSNWAYERLHEAIREGAIEPGQRVMETEVSAWLRISRTPVREAMRRLLAEGLLEHGANGGLAVALYDLRAINEFYATRERLEGAAAALAAEHADPTEQRILSAMLEAMRALPPDPRAHARENQAFHEHIYRAAHNRFLLKSLRALLNFVPLLGRTTYNDDNRIEEAQGEHAEIVEAILARDPARAEDAARRHIRHAYNSRVRVVTEDVRTAAERRSLHKPILAPLGTGSPRG